MKHNLLKHIQVDIVVHAAGVVDSRMVENLIGALGERRKRTGNETYFVHVSTCFNLFLDRKPCANPYRLPFSPCSPPRLAGPTAR